MKKILSALMVICIVFTLAAPAAAFTCNGDGKNGKLNYLLLGDSIARGAGVLNPDEACYGLMVANTNGYNYSNRAIDGYTSTKLLALMETDDVKRDIKEADIISISIGGNDYLTSDIGKLFFDSFSDEKAEFLRIQAAFYENFCKIIGNIKKQNPRALILVQTLYNMRKDILTGVNRIGADKLNECFRRYLKEHPNAYILIDVGAVLDGRTECLAIDTIHPNVEGNKEIARLILKALKKKGLGKATEPVMAMEPIETSGFGFRYLYNVITYYIRYWSRRLNLK